MIIQQLLPWVASPILEYSSVTMLWAIILSPGLPFTNISFSWRTVSFDWPRDHNKTFHIILSFKWVWWWLCDNDIPAVLVWIPSRSLWFASIAFFPNEEIVARTLATSLPSYHTIYQCLMEMYTGILARDLTVSIQQDIDLDGRWNFAVYSSYCYCYCYCIDRHDRNCTYKSKEII